MKIKSVIHYIVIIGCLVLFLISCGGNKIQNALDIADDLMESDPDSSLSILKTIEKSEFNRHEKARFLLLKFQALYKTKTKIDAYTTLKFAIEVFRNSDEKNLLGRALYYEAERSYKIREPRKSVYYCREAYEISLETKDPLLRARTADLLGYIYTDFHNYVKAAKSFNEAATQFVIAGKHLNNLYSLCDFADAISRDNPKRAREILDSIRRIAKKLPDEALVSYASNYLLPLQLNDNQDSEVQEYLENAVKEPGYTMGQNDSIYLALHYLGVKNFGEAKKILDEINKNGLSDTDKSQLLHCYAIYYYNIRDYKSSVENLDSSLRIRENHMKKIYMNSIYDAENEFYAYQKNMEHIQNTKLKEEMLISVVLLGVVGILIIILLLLIRKKELTAFDAKLISLSAEIESNLQSYNNSRREYEDNIEILNKKLGQSMLEEDRLKTYINEKFIQKSRICGEIQQEYEAEKMNGSVKISKFKEWESKLSTLISEEERNSIFDEVKFYHKGLIEDFEEAFPDLSKDDLMLYGLCAAGYSMRAISLFLGVQMDAVYKRRSRLKKKIEKSENPRIQFFITRAGWKV